MLSKQHRLPVGEFPSKAYTLLKGRVVLAKTTPNTLGVLRVGVLVSRKRIKSAAVRNAFKRTVLNDFSSLANKPKDVGVDLLIILATPIIKLDSQVVSGLLQDLETAKALLSGSKTIK